MKKIKKFLHDKLGWGFPVGLLEQDHFLGFQDTYECRFCGWRLAKDSQGNWFHLSSRRNK